MGLLSWTAKGLAVIIVLSPSVTPSPLYSPLHPSLHPPPSPSFPLPPPPPSSLTLSSWISTGRSGRINRGSAGVRVDDCGVRVHLLCAQPTQGPRRPCATQQLCCDRCAACHGIPSEWGSLSCQCWYDLLLERRSRRKKREKKKNWYKVSDVFAGAADYPPPYVAYPISFFISSSYDFNSLLRHDLSLMYSTRTHSNLTHHQTIHTHQLSTHPHLFLLILSSSTHLPLIFLSSILPLPPPILRPPTHHPNNTLPPMHIQPTTHSITITIITIITTIREITRNPKGSKRRLKRSPALRFSSQIYPKPTQRQM